MGIFKLHFFYTQNSLNNLSRYCKNHTDYVLKIKFNNRLKLNKLNNLQIIYKRIVKDIEHGFVKKRTRGPSLLFACSDGVVGCSHSQNETLG